MNAAEQASVMPEGPALQEADTRVLPVTGDGMVRSIVPQRIRIGKTASVSGAAAPQASAEAVTILFRPARKLRDARITAYADDRAVARRRVLALTPGEMCRIQIDPEKLQDAKEVRIQIDQEDGEVAAHV